MTAPERLPVADDDADQGTLQSAVFFGSRDTALTANAALTAARAASAPPRARVRTSAPRHAAVPSAPAQAWRSTWTALAITSVARGILAVLGCLLLWSVVPAVLGWHSTVVMSGSMEPRLHVGDVVVSRPINPATVRPGQVLLVNDPDHPGRLRLHRLAVIRPDGMLTLRGDANPQNDSTPVARSAVHGVGSLHIPYIGEPVYWATIHDYRDLVLLAAVLGVLIWAACVFRLGSADDEGRERTDPPRPEKHRRRWVRLGAPVAIVLALTATPLVTAPAARAATKFTGSGTNAGNSWSAATYFSCANAAVSDGARLAWPLNETTGTDANDITGNELDGTYSNSGVTYRTAGPCNNQNGVTLNGTNGNIAGSATGSNISDLSFEIWFKTSGSHGGTLESLTTTLFGTTTMVLEVNSSGTLTLAIAAGSTKSVTTTAAFNDNQWHLAVGVIGANGMALYVDNRAPVTSNAVTSAATASGTFRVGYGNHNSLGVGTNNYFQGSVAYAALYKLSLTASQVLSHYNAV